METAAAVFAQVWDAETDAGELLEDDGWKAMEVEPVPGMVGVNGTNSHPNLFGVGPTVDLVPDRGHPPVNGN